MKLWLDAHLSPKTAAWLQAEFAVEALTLRDVGLRDAADEAIFAAARKANAVLITKDADFVVLLERFGPPPQIIWLTCGNTSNERLRVVLTSHFPSAAALLAGGEALIEVSS